MFTRLSTEAVRILLWDILFPISNYSYMEVELNKLSSSCIFKHRLVKMSMPIIPSLCLVPSYESNGQRVSIVRRRRNTQTRDPPWLWNPGSEVTNSLNHGYQWPFKKDSRPPECLSGCCLLKKVDRSPKTPTTFRSWVVKSQWYFFLH